MPEPGDTFTLYDGSELTVLERPSGPEDKLVMKFVFPDGCGSPPAHTHPYSSEVFTVEQGSFELLVGRQWKKVSAGESLTVSPGVRHTYRNSSGAGVVVHNVHDPHHEFEAYIREIAALTHEAKAAEPKTPMQAMKAAMMFRRYPDLIRPADLPLKIAFPLLDTVGRIARVSLPAPV